MSEKKYSKKHEWVLLNGESATVGISKHATEMLGDIVFVELPEKGKSLNKDEKAAVVESTKAASDVFTPVSGEILENNQPIVDDPSNVNKDPENNSNQTACRLERYDKCAPSSQNISAPCKLPQDVISSGTILIIGA